MNTDWVEREKSEGRLPFGILCPVLSGKVDGMERLVRIGDAVEFCGRSVTRRVEYADERRGFITESEDKCPVAWRFKTSNLDAVIVELHKSQGGPPVHITGNVYSDRGVMVHLILEVCPGSWEIEPGNWKTADGRGRVFGYVCYGLAFVAKFDAVETGDAALEQQELDRMVSAVREQMLDQYGSKEVFIYALEQAETVVQKAQGSALSMDIQKLADLQAKRTAARW